MTLPAEGELHGPGCGCGCHYQPPTTFLMADGRFLSGPASGSPVDVAMNYLRTNAAQFGLSAADFDSVRISDGYTEANGTTRLYFMQQLNGRDVPYANFSISLTARGEVIAAGGGFVAGLQGYPVAIHPTLTSIEALTLAAAQLNLPAPADVVVTTSGTTHGDATVPVAGELPPGSPPSVDQAHVLDSPTLSVDLIPARLTYTATETGPRLTWDYVVNVPDSPAWLNFQVDGETGEVLSWSNWVDEAGYRVFDAPIEHPNDGGRTLETDPWDILFSPYGWHDTNGAAGAEFTDTRGNNVFAQDDQDKNNTGGFRPDGGAGLNFDFGLDLSQDPVNYLSASITNLFYWNNLNHDLHAVYGFTEAAGNFQEMNYAGAGGLGSDHVWADALDGSGTNNANFGTPPDGSNPRMQMFRWTSPNPDRDSDLDNGVITHEYGHGVSNRLTGGPGNSNALNAQQSGGMGEGWSDWWALMFTQRPTDVPATRMPIGAYLIGQDNPATAVGIRTNPYSFDQSINKMSFLDYGTGGGKSTAVHWAGARWASALWDLNWLLIAKHGYDADLTTGYDANGTAAQRAGNKLALQLVTDGLKLQPANPSFIQARDAILAADTALTGGANHYEIWLAFARRALGTEASTPASTSSSLTTSFNAPPGQIAGTFSSGTVNEGNSVTLNGSFVDALPGFTLAVDPNLTDSHVVTIDWGDGTAPDVLSLGAGVTTFSMGHTFRDNAFGGGDTPVTITVADQLNRSGTGTASITVVNLPPAPQITGAPTSGNEGKSVTVSATANDPGLLDTFTYDWTVLKNGAAYTTGAGKNFTYTPDDNGTFTVSVVVTDDDGGSGEAAPVTITATNVAPTATLAPPAEAKRFLPAAFSFLNPVDVSADKTAGFTYFFDFNNDGDFTDAGDVNGSKNSVASVTFPTVGPKTVRGRIRDKDGGFTDHTASVTVVRGGNQGIITTRHVAIGADAGGSSGVQVYGVDGKQKSEITAFNGFTGGVRVATGDITGDGIEDIITARGAGKSADAAVKVFSGSDNSLIWSFNPGKASYTGGYQVAAGDFDRDDYDDVVVAHGTVNQPIMIYSGRTGLLIKQFKPTGFAYGTTVALADVTGDGWLDLVVGAASRSTQVAVINGVTGKTAFTMTAFAPGYKGGVYVAAGDLDGDGFADLFLGSGAQAGLDSRARVVSGKTRKSIWDFAAFPNFSGGTRIAAKDLDADGKADFLIAPGAGTPEQAAKIGPSVFGMKGANLTNLIAMTPMPTFLGGIFVG